MKKISEWYDRLVTGGEWGCFVAMVIAVIVWVLVLPYQAILCWVKHK